MSQETLNLQVELVTFHCLAETNDWEGETWYHYFLDGPNVLSTLELIAAIPECDFELETSTLSWDEAEKLTNQDDGEYMQKHWFGTLTDIEGLRKASSDDLYKGKIRDYGEELFGYDKEEED